MVSVGIDEVGRGCWAGPVVAGAVALDAPISGLKDSKKLSRLQREKLAADIYRRAKATGLGWVTATEVDDLGLTKAVGLAMQRALEEITIGIDEIIIDGSYNFMATDSRARAVIKADDLVPSVSAASIIAKVARDNYMRQQSKIFPQYKFESHVGYGTSLHSSMLLAHGICSLHRRSYKPIQALLEASK